MVDGSCEWQLFLALDVEIRLLSYLNSCKKQICNYIGFFDAHILLDSLISILFALKRKVLPQIEMVGSSCRVTTF